MLRFTILLLALLAAPAEAGRLFNRRHPCPQPCCQAAPAANPASTCQQCEGGACLTAGEAVQPVQSALDEVNAIRARSGLPPFIFDAGLTAAAQATAKYRAERLMFGHVPGSPGDFGFVPAGTRCTATGCAAYPASYGWMSCCVRDNYRYAGAAFVVGRDGKRYMSLFCR